MRKRINCPKPFICQRHYKGDQILNHVTRKTVKPGEIPILNLHTKSIPSTSSSTKPRESADIVLLKRLSSVESFITTHNNECYQSFSVFLTRVQSLKLHDWDVSITSSVAHFSLKDDFNVVPKFEIYIDEHLSFIIQFILWCLPNNHEIYSQYGGSLKNIILSNIVKTPKLLCMLWSFTFFCW